MSARGEIKISPNQSLQSYLTEWISAFIKSFFTFYTNNYSLSNSSSEEMLHLLDKNQKFTFERHYKNIHTREDLEKLITSIVKVQMAGTNSINSQNYSQLFSDFFLNHLLFSINKYRENFLKSFTHLKEAYSNILELFKAFESPYNLYDVIKFYMRLLYFSSSLADEELEKKGEKPNQTDECGRILISFFSAFQMSDEKQIVFYCIICLIRIYFKMRTYRNSKTLVGWVEKSGLDFDSLPKSEVVTYFYYSARLAMYELRLIEAREILLNAFKLCKEDHLENKKLLLEYLIPLNMFTGQLPNDRLLINYNLTNYLPLVEAFRNGDLVGFENEIEKLEDRLVTLGTFLIIEKVKSYVLRNLIKNVYRNYSESLSKMNNPVIKIELIQKVMNKVYNYDISMDDLELNIIATIYKGLVSGYVHSNNKVIVFSKKNPFPNLEENFKNNYSKII